METPFRNLLRLLEWKRPVLIQTHDFPDHDAVGAAYGLAQLLKYMGFTCEITYGGSLQSISLANMLDRLGIRPISFIQAAGDPEWQTLVVDGSPMTGTVRTVGGTLTGIIDHHPARKKASCPFSDIRTGVGSCSTIIWEYWNESGETPDQVTATALLSGIQLDTDFLTRRVSPSDLNAHYNLFFLGDRDLARDLVRISLSVNQLPDIGKAFTSYLMRDGLILLELHGEYSAEILSVLADFLLRLREVTFAAVIEVMGEEYRLSVRNRDKGLDAGYIVRKLVAKRGTGGGHPHMAGASLLPEEYPGAEAFMELIRTEIEAYRSAHNETDNQKN
jgi:nanoRNase/pAp phosphatase (c-di-AMP/oligoRNAs hydrolase)